MKKDDIGEMSVNQLWDLHLELGDLLAKRITVALVEVEQRLSKLDTVSVSRAQRSRGSVTTSRVIAEKELAAEEAAPAVL